MTPIVTPRLPGTADRSRIAPEIRRNAAGTSAVIAMTNVCAITHPVPPRRASVVASGRSEAQNATPSGPHSNVRSDANSGFRARLVLAS
jgi:hypothetical protein